MNNVAFSNYTYICTKCRVSSEVLPQHRRWQKLHFTNTYRSFQRSWVRILQTNLKGHSKYSSIDLNGAFHNLRKHIAVRCLLQSTCININFNRVPIVSKVFETYAACNRSRAWRWLPRSHGLPESFRRGILRTFLQLGGRVTQ